MNPETLNDDVLAFAEHLGLTGSDSELFYESYYGLNNDEYEYEEEYAN